MTHVTLSMARPTTPMVRAVMLGGRPVGKRLLLVEEAARWGWGETSGAVSASRPSCVVSVALNPLPAVSVPVTLTLSSKDRTSVSISIKCIENKPSEVYYSLSMMHEFSTSAFIATAAFMYPGDEGKDTLKHCHP